MLHMLNDESNVNSPDGIGSQFDVLSSSTGMPVRTAVGEYGNMYESTSRLTSFPMDPQSNPNTRLFPSSQYPPLLRQSTDRQYVTGQRILSCRPPEVSVTGTHLATSSPSMAS